MTNKINPLSVVSKFFKKILNHRLIEHLQKLKLFSIFQFGFRFFQPTIDFLTVFPDRIARAFYRFGATLDAALDKFKALNRVVACLSSSQTQTFILFQ